MTALLLASACGGAQHPDPSAAFASIQVDEAAIERASLALSNGTGGDADRRALCDASEHLCATAATLDDADSAIRCRHARERCEQVTCCRAP